jgi:short-subunit dehydrogenase involved in D-alanine esterification of teichoic acids
MSIYNTILITGATSGMGLALAKHLHSQGKTVIATGRRQDRLSSLSATHPGIYTSCFDVSDLSTLATNLDAILENHPNIDTVILNAGIQNMFSFLDTENQHQRVNEISREVATNLTAPIVIAQHFIPFFIKAKEPRSLIFVSSGFAFIPVPYFPVYCPTKAAIHSFCVALRAQLHGSNVKIIEVVPPYVDTELDQVFRKKLIEVMGGEEKAIKPMKVQELVEETAKGLEGGGDEVPVGHFPEMAIAKWREAFGGIMEGFGVKG